MKVTSFSNFSVTVYGDLKPYNQTTSLGRCRIFYKGLNRNGSYISDEFANKLLTSLPYTPVKGIYDEIEEDFGSHGYANSLGRIYGVVPENPNITWEVHTDEDGVSRHYACCDVLIYSALYKEASEILNKSESMELYPPSIKGQWTMIEGKRAFEFTDGCFFGLQVLGDEIQPCFEGASFFTLDEKICQAFEKLQQLEESFTKVGDQGDRDMDFIFKLSDSQKQDKLFMLLNPMPTEENAEWEINYAVCDIYDDYALVYKYESGEYFRVYYTKTEDNVEINEQVKAYIVDISENEKAALDSLKQLNGGSFENVDSSFNKIEELEQRISSCEEEKATLETNVTEYQTQIEELNQNVQTAQEALTAKETEYAQLEVNYQAVQTSLSELEQYKVEIEKAQKQALINKYSEQLNKEVLDKYSADMDITVKALEKELAFELVNSNPSIFSEKEPNYVPKETPASGIEAILNKYKK